MVAVDSPGLKLIPSFRFSYLSLQSTLVTLLYLPRYSTSLSFNFDFSQPGGYSAANMSFDGDAFFNSQVIELTRNDRNQGLDNSVGRATYAQPVPIWDEGSGELASFTTTFSIKILPDNTNNNTGDGMAFFLGHYPSSIPSFSGGGNLGLFSYGESSTNAKGDNRVVAVEFDTYKNTNYGDTSENHMGIDINSLISTAHKDTSVNLTSGLVMSCQVSYVNSTKRLTAGLQIVDATYHVETSADLRLLLPSMVAIGFSGATGIGVELHQVLAWSFNSTLDRPSPPSPARGGFLSKVPWKIVGAVIAVVAVAAFCALLIRLRKRWPCAGKASNDKLDDEQPEPATSLESQQDEEEKPDEEDPVEVVLPHIPKLFRYHELEEATEGFAQHRQLGKGAFATVYRGDLTSPTLSVAIKRFELQDGLRKKSFDDEITAISLVSHRCLVKLLGWCKDAANNLMLVYELVPGGNLHQHLHEGKSWLSWSTRYKIIIELAEALQYLHNGSPKRVVHGDIKPSNILLDSNYAIKLSDFGLARLVDHGIGAKMTSTVIGTSEYLDPEFVKTGERSDKTDVYSFGIVLLEIVSGQLPTAVDHRQTNQVTQLLNDVQDAHRRGTILDAAHSKLKAESASSDDHAQMERVLQVGLWCARLNSSERPAIAEAQKALQFIRDVEIPPRLSSQLEAGQSSK